MSSEYSFQVRFIEETTRATGKPALLMLSKTFLTLQLAGCDLMQEAKKMPLI
jgi:hypothetical protein